LYLIALGGNGSCRWVAVMSPVLGQASGAGSRFRKGNVVTVFDGDCLDGPQGCEGETFPRQTLAGSGDSYSR